MTKILAFWNNAWDLSLIVVYENSLIKIFDSEFEENFSYGTGGVVWADYQQTLVEISNTSFIRNGAFYGGAISALSESLITCNFCIFSENFGFYGGVIYSYNGYVSIQNS